MISENEKKGKIKSQKSKKSKNYSAIIEDSDNLKYLLEITAYSI
jgi:hypothetical protein